MNDSREHLPKIGDRVVSVSGVPLGTVNDASSFRFSIDQLGRHVWLDPTVVFHRQATTLTLICEPAGLSRFSVQEVDARA